MVGQPFFPAENGVDQLLEIIKVELFSFFVFLNNTSYLLALIL
ncbi:hypothetical protein PanWU01x14_024870 [Parasponia andersonii]|uniref:Uncharacterized protein n=1 Tax=Parasponia andersonii TaxID=3476 RepID=A0A2P5DWS6_PARAD|nr:hypothetical protein PanWU01x14_024870 [Parasponia andersonii]